MKKCVEDIVQSASSARGGKDSVVNGLVTIVVPETELIYACDWLLGNGFTFCHMEVTEDTVGNGAIVDADINLAVRKIDLYRAAGDSRAIVEIDLHVVRYDAKLDHKASISINRTPAQIAKSWYDHKQTDEGKDDELSYVTFVVGPDLHLGQDSLTGAKMFVNTGVVKSKSRSAFGLLPFEEKITVYVEGPARDDFESVVSPASKDVRDQLGALRVDGKPTPIR